MTVWRGRYVGKLARVNEWHGARSVAGKARVYATTAFKDKKATLAILLAGPAPPLTEQVDLVVEVTLWKQTDTDAPIKAIMDALEDAGVIENDRQIRHITILRGYHKRDEKDALWLALESIEDEGPPRVRSFFPTRCNQGRD